jgi:hypothetical protein
LAIISNGYDNITQTDGAIAWELGACKAGTATSGGSLDATADYEYEVTWTSGTEIINGAISNRSATTADNKTIPITNIPQGPTGFTTIKLYRNAGVTVGNTIAHTDHKLLATYTVSTGLWDPVGATTGSATTYYDDTVDTSLGAAIGAVTDDMPKGAILYIGQERLFVTGDPSYSNTVYYSDQFLPHYLHTGTTNLSTTAASTYYDFISKQDNDFITGLTSYLGTTYVFKQNSIRPYYISGTPDTWTLGDPVSTNGSPAPKSIVTSPYGIIYQGWDYIYLFNGNFSQPIAPEFPVFTEVLSSRISYSQADVHKGQYLISYTDASLGHQYNDRVAIYDLINKQVSIDKGGTLASGSVNINCIHSAKGGTEGNQLYTGDSVLGWVYKYERIANIISYSTTTDIDTGTHTDTDTSNTSDNPVLSREYLDLGEYSTDALVQAAWVSSDTATTEITNSACILSFDGSGTTITDDTGNHTSFTCRTGVTQTTGASKFGGSSCYFPGENDQSITVGDPTSSHWDALNNTNWTWDAWIYPTSTSGTLMWQGDANVLNWNISLGGFDIRPNDTWTGPVQFSGIIANTWQHIAICKVGSDWGAYVNGVQTSYVSFSTTYNWGTYCEIGGALDPSTEPTYTHTMDCFQGYIDELRVSTANSFGAAPVVGKTDVIVSWQHAYGANLQSFSSTTANEGIYAVDIGATRTNSLNDTLTKTISSTDLSASTHDKILIDVYASRTGTNFQFGIDEAAGDFSGTGKLQNVEVTVANTWETKALDFSSVTDAAKDAITQLRIKITNADEYNKVLIDNIRPGLSSVTWTSPVVNISASSFGNISWNESLGSYGNCLVYTRNADTSAHCAAGVWSSALTTPGGSTVVAYEYTDGTTVTTDPTDMAYFQFKMVLSSTDSDNSYASFPYLYKTGGYLVKFEYYKTSSVAETSVEFKYRTGYRNFDQPLMDKIFKKMALVYDGSPGGNLTVSYDIDNEEGTSYTFTDIALSTYKYKWESFFPSTAFGRSIRWNFYKNDAYDFKLKQIGAIIELEPII